MFERLNPDHLSHTRYTSAADWAEDVDARLRKERTAGTNDAFDNVPALEPWYMGCMLRFACPGDSGSLVFLFLLATSVSSCYSFLFSCQRKNSVSIERML